MSKKVLFLVNHDVVIYNFRLEIVERLLKEGYEVHISSPQGVRIAELINLGCIYHEIEISRHGMNPLEELKLIAAYRKLFSQVQPDIILSYTIKPNIYGAIAAKKFKIPFVANITGLGTAVEYKSWKQPIFAMLYRYAFKDVSMVFFQNTENRDFFLDRKMLTNSYDLLPGSGVNLEKFALKAYPSTEKIRFAFISRIMVEKGIDQLIEAAQALVPKYPQLEFHIYGFCEGDYQERLEKLTQEGILTYHGMTKDIAKVLEDSHCLIHPSYYPEGISNVLLEASAVGRPLITTDRAGCREVIDEGKNGFIVKMKDSQDLIAKIEQFLKLTPEQQKEMGLYGRRKVEKEFDRQIVVNRYLEEIEKIE